MLQSQAEAVKGHFLILILGYAIQTGLEFKSSVLEAVEKQCFLLMPVLNFII